MAGVLTGVEQWFYEQWVYELLIEGLSRSVDELRALAGDRQDDIGAAVSALEARTLLLRRPGEPPRYDVRHPQEGVAALLAARQEQLRHVAALVLHHRAEK